MVSNWVMSGSELCFGKINISEIGRVETEERAIN